MKNLYIDIGSTNIKYCLNDNPEKSVLFPNPILNTCHKYEVSVDEIIKIVVDIINEQEVDNVYFSCQMHGYILSDVNHRPITNYISWKDSRTLQYSNLEKLELGLESGTSLKQNTPAYSIISLFKENPTLAKKSIYFDSLGSYIVYYLTKNHYIHLSDACPTGFYLLNNSLNTDITKLKYYKDLNFPLPCDFLKCAGKYKNANIYVAIGDMQASVIGAEIDSNSYLLNTGTTTQLCILTNKLLNNIENRWYLNKSYLGTINFLPGGDDIKPENYDSIKEKLCKAMEKIPPRDKLILAGGPAIYHKDLFDKIFENKVKNMMYINYVSTLQGLKKLAERTL